MGPAPARAQEQTVLFTYPPSPLARGLVPSTVKDTNLDTLPEPEHPAGEPRDGAGAAAEYSALLQREYSALQQQQRRRPPSPPGSSSSAASSTPGWELRAWGLVLPPEYTAQVYGVDMRLLHA